MTGERLRAIVDHLTEEKPCSGCSDIIRAELLQLSDELEELRRDKARLDWLDALPDQYEFIPVEFGNTIREAIDAAMQGAAK